MGLREELAIWGIALPDELPVEHWASKLIDSPARNTAISVALSSILFYAAERDWNPKVNDIYDAMVYCSTCLSVGYGDIFAKTPAGKIIGTALMTLGPALSGAALDGKPSPQDQTQAEILKTLQAILGRLPAAPAAD